MTWWTHCLFSSQPLLQRWEVSLFSLLPPSWLLGEWESLDSECRSSAGRFDLLLSDWFFLGVSRSSRPGLPCSGSSARILRGLPSLWEGDGDKELLLALLLGERLSFLLGEAAGERDLDRERVRFLACVRALPPVLNSAFSVDSSRSCLATKPFTSFPLGNLWGSTPRAASSLSFLSVHLFFSFCSSSLTSPVFSCVRFLSLGSFFVPSADFWISASTCLFLLWTLLTNGDWDLDLGFSSGTSFLWVLALSGLVNFSGARAELPVVVASALFPAECSLCWEPTGGPVRFRRGSLVDGLESVWVWGGIHGRTTGAVWLTSFGAVLAAAGVETGVDVGTTNPPTCRDIQQLLVLLFQGFGVHVDKQKCGAVRRLIYKESKKSSCTTFVKCYRLLFPFMKSFWMLMFMAEARGCISHNHLYWSDVCKHLHHT